MRTSTDSVSRFIAPETLKRIIDEESARSRFVKSGVGRADDLPHRRKRDADFDRVPALRRVDPLNKAERLRLIHS